MSNVFLNAARGAKSNASIVSQLKAMAKGNPSALYSRLMQTNPQFARFVEDNQGKTPEQIAKENGIDYNYLRRFL